MDLNISTPNGKRFEAMVLAVGENRLRAVVAGCNDTVELWRNYGQWSSDLGDVELEALASNHGIDMSRFCADFCSRERAAGSKFTEQTDGMV